MKITWFRHDHEHRNDLLRFGFMRLHYRGEMEYSELPLSDARRYGFSKAVIDYPDHRHLSFILAEAGKSKIKCLVDNEDSFALVTPLIAEVDVCFCAGYNADFFERKQFVNAYSWQQEADIAGYRELMERKIEKFGHHFRKVRRFIPIAPNQGTPVPPAPWKQKIKNLEHRMGRVIGRGNDYADVYQAFERRQQYLNNLRNEPLAYDIVLHDSLWGWPKHRLNLHHRLGELAAKQYKVHSVLNWNPPVDIDGSAKAPLSQAAFPVRTAPIHDSYEKMLAQSRLAVFACGFHWGWRNIMMLALQAGIPVLTDRLLTEPYFDINEFSIFQQEDHQWNSIEKTISTINNDQWLAYKEASQKVYDRYMTPEAVSYYFINTLN